MRKVYNTFLSLLPADKREEGKLSRSTVYDLYRKCGVKNERVLQSLFRVWDIDSDDYVDFHEVKSDGVS